jgi:hypothetical protein
LFDSIIFPVLRTPLNDYAGSDSLCWHFLPLSFVKVYVRRILPRTIGHNCLWTVSTKSFKKEIKMGVGERKGGGKGEGRETGEKR